MENEWHDSVKNTDKLSYANVRNVNYYYPFSNAI